MTSTQWETVTVDAPMETVWESVNDVALWPAVVGADVAVRLLQRTPADQRFELTDGRSTWSLRQTLRPAERTAELEITQSATGASSRQQLAFRATSGGTEVSRLVDEHAEDPLRPPLARLVERVPAAHPDPSGPDLAAAARRLAPDVAAAGAAQARAHTVRADLVASLRAAGLYSMGLPRALGGRESDFRTLVSVVEEISRADGATGWHVLIGNTNAFLAWLEPSVARDLLSSGPSPALAGSTALTGHGEPLPDGAFRVTGRWPFCSGSLHAGVVMAGFRVDDGTAPGPLPNARVAFLPASVATLDGTWRPMGLEATGSHDLQLEAVDVARERTAALYFEPALHDGPLYRLTPYNILMVLLAGFPLGVARRAVDEAAALARTKIRPGSRAPLMDDPETVSALADAEASVRASRALVLETLDEAQEVLAAGSALSGPQRARIALATGHALRQARTTTSAMLRLGGASALRLDHPLQQCLRDVHAAGQHFGFSDDLRQRFGRTLLDLPTSPALYQV